jgi:hypothetical protein
MKMLAGRRPGAVIAAMVAVAVVSAGGTAAGLTIASSGPVAGTVPTAAPAPPPAENRSPLQTAPTSGPTPPAGVGSATIRVRNLSGSNLISDTCLFSHEANDDPILDPGLAGQSMAHDFFGNTTTSATSTAATLVGGPTTCSTGDDASAYWTPILYQNGVAITPTHNLIYWSGLQAMGPAVTIPPAGLEMIAGDESATAPQSTRVIDWRCAEPLDLAVSAVPVNCPGTKGLELRVTFPSCWDGRTLNGASQTNVAYPDRGACPEGYPVRIPTVVFHLVYPITSAAGLTLSMGPGQQGSTDTAHGDFINGWNQSVLTELIDGCAGPAHHCGRVTGSVARVHPKEL